MANAEKLFLAGLQEFSWAGVREAMRPLRGKVSVLVGPGGRVIYRSGPVIGLRPIGAHDFATRATRFEAEDAAGAAEALSKRIHRPLTAVDVYEFAKARQYVERARLASMKEGA